MLDKVIVVSKHQAYMIFDHRPPFGIYSDVDVLPLLMWLLDSKQVHVTVDSDNNFVGVELRQFNDEVTLKIVRDAA